MLKIAVLFHTIRHVYIFFNRVDSKRIANFIFLGDWKMNSDKVLTSMFSTHLQFVFQLWSKFGYGSAQRKWSEKMRVRFHRSNMIRMWNLD